MLKAKQPINKIKNCVVRKPSLPLKRTSSVQSNYSDQSCMSDRIIYKKSLPQQLSSRHLEVIQTKNYVSNTFEQQRSDMGNTSQKSLKKIKNKLNMSNAELMKKSQHHLTAFQWLIIMRHCFHIENKRRSANCIKHRTLVNYIRNKMYPDSLWNKILVLQNECKISASDIIATIQKNQKWKFNLDDILVCISKYFSHANHPILEDHHESAAQTARFTQNMKPNLEQKQSLQLEPYSQPKFIYKKIESKAKNTTNIPTNNLQNVLINVQPKVNGVTSVKKQSKNNKEIQQISTIDINNFHIDNQLGLSISPISVNNQTNNISFSMEESEPQSHMHFHSPKSILERQDRFDIAFSGIQSLKLSLQNSKKARQEKIHIINFLQQILSYSIYKNKEKRNSKRSIHQIQKDFKNEILAQDTQYFYGLKLQNRCSLEKISIQIIERLFGSRQFAEYFQNLQAIKISEFYDELPIALPVLGSNLRILNLSHNNLRSVSFLKEMNINLLQFINLNNNKITNISDLLCLEKLEQIHAKENMIDHVISDKVLAKGLRIIDLGNNYIQKQEDIFSLSSLTNLRMVNLSGNLILTTAKSNFFLNKDVIVDHTEMYIFSSFTQYKDIAFGKAKQKEAVKDNRTQRAQSLSEKQNKI